MKRFNIKNAIKKLGGSRKKGFPDYDPPPAPDLPMRIGRHSLPNIKELYKDTELVIKRSKLNALVNQEPSPGWIKDHPMFKREVIREGKKVEVPVQHVPIERLQWLMKRIYGGYTREVLDFKLLANSITCHVRIHYRDPLTGLKTSTDGVGAVPCQTDRNAGATEFDKIKTHAVMKGLPAAATYAEKDAIGSLGRLFGGDLNRDIETEYTSLGDEFDVVKMNTLKTMLSKLMAECDNPKKTSKVMDEITDKEATGEPQIEDYEKWIQQLQK